MDRFQLQVGIWCLVAMAAAYCAWAVFSKGDFPEKLTVQNQYNQTATLDYDQITHLTRMLKHDGLTKEEVGRMYDLKYKPIADCMVKDKPFEMQCLRALERKKYVSLKDGLWELTYEGIEAVK